MKEQKEKWMQQYRGTYLSIKFIETIYRFTVSALMEPYIISSNLSYNREKQYSFYVYVLNDVYIETVKNC